MAVEAALQRLGHFSSRHKVKANVVLPVYETLPNDDPPRTSGEAQSYPSSPATSTTTTTYVHQAPDMPPHPRTSTTSWPSLRTFLADFTLGFADGLTVPFALTAGLSSLGQTSTVRYAGMAEICAGSISMGIGGYLAARGGRPAASREAELGGTVSGGDRDGEDDDVCLPVPAGLPSECRDWEKRDDHGHGHGGGSGMAAAAADSETWAAIARHLAPLRLPPDLEETVLAHLRWHGYDRGAIVADTSPKPAREEEGGRSPVLAGLSVALGYLVGGVIPLFPYFFVSVVGTGLLWSFLVCIIALFTFGFGKEFVLNESSDRVLDENSIPWSRVRSSMWEGLQMVFLGGIAALAAVLCVRAFEGVL